MNTGENAEAEEIENCYQLEFQGSMPVCGNTEGELHYRDLQIFLESISSEAKLDAQVVKFLGP